MQMIDLMKRLAELDAKNPNFNAEGATMPKNDPRDNLDSLHPEAPGNRTMGRSLKDKISQRTGQDVYGQGRAAAGMKPIHNYATKPHLPDRLGKEKGMGDDDNNILQKIEKANWKPSSESELPVAFANIKKARGYFDPNDPSLYDPTDPDKPKPGMKVPMYWFKKDNPSNPKDPYAILWVPKFDTIYVHSEGKTGRFLTNMPADLELVISQGPKQSAADTPSPLDANAAAELVDLWIGLHPRYGGYDDVRGQMIRMVQRDPAKRKEYQDEIKIAQQKKAQQSQGVAESLEECGMMGGMSSQPHSPASINMTAATGEELSSMLKDIMTLAGRPMGGEEPMGGANGVAVVDMEPDNDVEVEPSPGVSTDEPSIMRSMLDKLNPADDEEEKVDEYDNTLNPEIAGYDAAVPSGNDLHKEKSQYPAAQSGDNPMAATYESLMSDYRKFVAESDQGVAEGSMTHHYFSNLAHQKSQANNQKNNLNLTDIIKNRDDDAYREWKKANPNDPMISKLEAAEDKGNATMKGIQPLGRAMKVFWNTVFDELSRQGVAEGGGNDEVIRFKNGYTAWIKKLTPYLNREAQPHIWVYKTPEGVTSDAEAVNKIENLEPVAKFHSTQDMYDAMENGTVGQQGVAEGEEDSSNIESLKSFFNKLRDQVERGFNVLDTFHTGDAAGRLPAQGKRLRQIMKFLRNKAAEADAAQDNPQEMQRIMLAAIDKAESELRIQSANEGEDILRLAGLR